MAYLYSSTQGAIDMAKDIVTAAEHSRTREDFSTHWEMACKAEWWPFEDRTCTEIRCTACAPAIMSAGAVCDAVRQGQESPRSFGCMQRVSI